MPNLAAIGKFKKLGLGLFLFWMVIGLYLPALQNDFVDYDDQYYVTNNSHIQSGLSFSFLYWAFTTGAASNWHPLTWISHALDFQIYGARPFGHHLSSILLHALNALLAFWVLSRITGSTWRSFIAAALFAVHPLRVESVAWVAERKDVLSACFFFLTLLAYTRFAQASTIPKAGVAARLEPPDSRPQSDGPDRRRGWWYAAALLCFVLGLLSKPMLVTLPCILLLLDCWPWRRFGRLPTRNLVVEKIPFFIVAAASSVITIFVQGHAGSVVHLAALPLDLRFQNSIISYCRYLGKMIWPWNLGVFYPYPVAWGGARVFLALLLIGGMTILALRQYRRRPFLIVGWAWYLIMLLPVIGLIQAGYQSMADRYNYLPGLGIFVMVVWSLGEVAPAITWRSAKASLAVAALVAEAWLTHRQLQFWRNSETLFRHSLQAAGDSATAHSGLASWYLKKGLPDDAIAEVKQALRDEPWDPYDHYYLGMALLMKNQVNESLPEFETCLQSQPENAEFLMSYGVALYRNSQGDKAVEELRQSVRLEPANPTLRLQFADILILTERYDSAIAEYQKLLNLKPPVPQLHFKLGVAMTQKHALDQAVLEFRAAVQEAPGDARNHYYLGGALAEAGATAEAIAELKKAVQLDDNLAAGWSDLARALDGGGESAEAFAAFENALRLEPSNPDTHNAFGASLARNGKIAEAIAQFKEALRLRPDYVEAKLNLDTALKSKDPKPE